MKYVISAITSPFGEPTGGDIVEHDPENAIIAWCRLGEKNPTCTSLQPESEKAGMELIRWAYKNFDKIEIWTRQHKCPYKSEWMKARIESQLKNEKTSMQWPYDEIVPFCMG